MCIILQSQAPPSSQSSSAVCITLQSQVIKSSQQTQWCATVHLTVETESAKGCTPRSQNRNLCESLAAFKGTIGEILPEGEQIYHEEKIWRKTIWFAKSKIFSNVVIEYLGEIETEFENILACLSRAQIGWAHEQNGGRKSHDTLPLICQDVE